MMTAAISAISGMGGIGKTELALQYVRYHCREGLYPADLCWIRAREGMAIQIITFVRSHFDLTPPEDLELVEKVRWCWSRWREGAALLILDDVQQYDETEPFLPPQESQFKVLVTTRSDFGSPMQDLPLDVLSEPQALELLQSLLKGKDGRDLRSFQNFGGLETAKQICEWLGYLPLGVELAGRHLARKPDLSFEKLWQRLQEKRLEAIAFKQAEPGMTASLGVAAAFELNWQSLEESAQKLAAVLSLFALVEIPWRLVEQCLPEIDAEELEEIRDRQLLGTHLLKRVDQGIYQLHQLLKEFFAAKRSQRADNSELQQRFYQVAIAEAERVEKKLVRSFINKAALIIPHLQAAMERFARPEQALDLATCLTSIAELYHLQGRYAKAEPLYVRSLSIREQLLGQDHSDVTQSLNNLANLYYSQGRYAEAEPLYVRSLWIWEQQLGADHPSVANSLNNLANLYESQGRYVGAEQMYTRSLAIREQQLGPSHPDVVYSLNGLATLYRLQGSYAEAESFLLRSVSILQEQLPTDHPLSARIHSNLAYLYDLQGRYREAESLYLQALPILFAKLEESHPYTQEATQQFRSLLQNAIDSDCTHELSDDPLTQELLKELKAGDGV